MRIYLDTNIIMEYFAHRDFYNDVAIILKAAEQKSLEAVLSTNSLDTIIYLLGCELKNQGIHEPQKRQKIREMVMGLLEYVDIVSISRDKIKEALSDDNFKDIEDSLQYYCAIENDIDHIITINTKHFKDAKKSLDVTSPVDFVNNYILGTTK